MLVKLGRPMLKLTLLKPTRTPALHQVIVTVADSGVCCQIPRFRPETPIPSDVSWIPFWGLSWEETAAKSETTSPAPGQLSTQRRVPRRGDVKILSFCCNPRQLCTTWAQSSLCRTGRSPCCESVTVEISPPSLISLSASRVLTTGMLPDQLPLCKCSPEESTWDNRATCLMRNIWLVSLNRSKN